MRISFYMVREERITPHEGEVTEVEVFATKEQAKEALRDKYDDEKDFYHDDDSYIDEKGEYASLGGDDDETRYEFNLYGQSFEVEKAEVVNMVKNWIPQLSKKQKESLITALTDSMK